MPTTNTRETKTRSFQIKATGIAVNAQGQEVGKIEAYTAMYDNVDEGNDRILAGSFKRTVHNAKARAKSRSKEYLFPMLWNHDEKHFLPLGGWYDVDADDATGLRCKGDVLLSTQVGHDYYELAKAGMTDQFSIIYDIPTGGAKYDKSGVRELSEIRLFSIDPVVFAMNDETYLVGVKRLDTLEYKAVCGNTAGPIGPRNDSWDGSAAKAWIWEQATDDDGKVKAAVAKKYFLRCDGDPSEKGSYGYPFWIHDHISVAGVKAVANALAGARGADAGGDSAGMRRKVATLYRRINAKYPDAEKLVPPWEEDDGKSQGGERPTKSLMDYFQDEMACDLLYDWQSVYLTSLTAAMRDALTSGDDLGQVLDDFKTLVLAKFLPAAEDIDLASYLQAQASAPSYYGYMADSRDHERKAGRAISAANADHIAEHIDALKSMARSHMKAIHTVADDFAATMQGAEAAYGTDAGDPGEGQAEGKHLAQALEQLKALHR